MLVSPLDVNSWLISIKFHWENLRLRLRLLNLFFFLKAFLTPLWPKEQAISRLCLCCCCLFHIIVLTVNVDRLKKLLIGYNSYFLTISFWYIYQNNFKHKKKSYTYKSKDITIQIHSFPILFNGRYFVNEISVTFHLEDFFGITILYLEISTPYTVCNSFFPIRGECTHVPSIRKMLAFTFWGNLFAAALECSLWTYLLKQYTAP